MLRLKSILIILIFLISIKTFSQETQKFSFDIYGILDMQGVYNERKTYSAIDGMFSLYPLPPSYGANHQDLNAKKAWNFSAASSRIGVRLGLGETLGAKITGILEADFTGQAGGLAHYFRLRMANINFKWDKTQVLIGQHWSPMVIPEMMPSNRDLHNGAPFHPFARQAQIRIDYQPIQALNLVAALGFQRDFANIGVSNTRDYFQQSNALTPELNLFMHYRGENLFFGLGAKLTNLQPREQYSIGSNIYSLDKKILTYTTTAFLNFKKKNHNFKTQALYGESMNDLSLLGGYYESLFDTLNYEFKYKPTSVFSSWIDYSYSYNKLKPALLIGYSKNFDVNESNFASSYGIGMDIDNYFRIAPRIEYFFQTSFSLTLTLEYASVKFKDEVANERVSGFRTAFALCYLFNY